MRKLLLSLLFVPCALLAQEQTAVANPKVTPFGHMEVGFTAGTPGLGADLSFPLNRHLKLRAGFAIMPKFGDTYAYSMSSVGAKGVDKGRMEHLAGLLGDMIGNKDIDDQIRMDRKISYWNAKMLLDWYPFHKKNWHFTAGFYVGSRRIADIHNCLNEAPTTVAILMYNDMYDHIQGLGPYEYPSITVGGKSYELDPIAGQEVIDKFNRYGRVAVRFGEDKDGTPFYTEPNRDGILKAEALVNAFKPYVGFGYNALIGKDKRWNIGFDAGIMVWGTPHIYCDGYKYHADAPTYTDRFEHLERVCLVHDIKGVGGNVGSTIKLIKNLPVLPVVEFKLAYRVF